MQSCPAVLASGVLAGGLVGYVTNQVAVWLLFHPARPLCFLGRRFCLWGVVPSRRRELARRFGRLVEEYVASGRVWRRVEEEMRSIVKDEAVAAVRRSPFAAFAGLDSVLADLVERFASSLASVSSSLVRKVDIGRLVEEELLRMDPEEVEKMFRAVAGRELRVVVYSGLVLGALVGLVQGLLFCLLG